MSSSLVAVAVARVALVFLVEAVAVLAVIGHPFKVNLAVLAQQQNFVLFRSVELLTP
jgi:hypothetical protein